MNKFCKMLAQAFVIVVVMVMNQGCSTQFLTVNSWSSETHQDERGGITFHSKSETYSYNSGVPIGQPMVVNNLIGQDLSRPLPPPTTRCYDFNPDFPKWKNIPNPIQGNGGGSGYSHGGAGAPLPGWSDNRCGGKR